MRRLLNEGVKRVLPAAVAVTALFLMPSSVAAAKPKASVVIEPASIAGISYGAVSEESLTAYPARTAGSTSVLLVHGGGWHKQTRETELPVVAEQLQSAGFAVFDADYPQDSGSEGAFPSEPNAIERAAEWVRANASAFQGSASNIVLVGGSAGGQLVEMTAARFPVQGVVSLSGPTNIVTLTELARENELKNGLGHDVLVAARCGSKGGCPESFQREWSPIDNIPTSCPPYLLFSSAGDEVPESQQTEFQIALAGAGCQVALELLPGSLHSFEYWPRVKATIDAFIAAH